MVCWDRWKNLTVLHIALNSNPSLGWIGTPTDQYPTSLMLVAKQKQVPAAMFQHLLESLPRTVEAVIVAKGGTNSIWMPMILEWDVQWAGVHILL
jgi:hypothetical protein